MANRSLYHLSTEAYVYAEWTTDAYIKGIYGNVQNWDIPYTAASNHTALLILQAPYYNFKDWANNIAPELDTSNIPYSFDNASFLMKVKCPVIVFHGNKDTAVYYGSSIKLSKLLKASDRFITLQNEAHSDFSKNKSYLSSIASILKSITPLKAMD